MQVAQSAYIKFVQGSAVSSLSLEELQQYLHAYKEQLALTGEQLSWVYENAGFPYIIETKPESDGRWFYLKGQDSYYKYIIMGLGSEQTEDGNIHFVQVVLPDGSTHGDKAKANEFCKHLSRKLQAELHLFNGRIMYFYPRK